MKPFIIAIFIIMALAQIFGCSSPQKRNADLTVQYVDPEANITKYKTFEEINHIIDEPGRKYIIFSAEWCKGCRSLEISLKQSNHLQLPNVALVNVDEPWAQELCSMLKIKGVPAMIIIGDNMRGGEIEQAIFGSSKIVMHFLIHVETYKTN